MRIAREEVFGPVLVVLPFDTDAEALAIANSGDFGLAAGIFTRDLDRAMRFVRDVEAGMVWVNEWFQSPVQVPHGGVKHSGLGREQGMVAFANYLQAKDVAGVKFIGRKVDGVSGKELAPLIEEMKQKLGSGAVVLLTEADGKATVAAGVTNDLTDRISAVALVQAAVAALGGKGGGGRPDRAQGGAPSLDAADAALAAVESVIAGA